MHCEFEDSVPQVLTNIRSDRELSTKYVKKKKKILEVDTQALHSVNIVRTNTVDQASHGVTHEEGGWPAQFANEITLEDVERIRKRIMKDEHSSQ